MPIRSKSEMSYRKPLLNQEWHGGILNNFNEILELPITKSKSSENVFNNSKNNQDISKEVKLTKSLNDYRLKVAKEDYLRQEIIKELLFDTELYRSQHVQGNSIPLDRKLFNVSKHNVDPFDEIDDEFVIPELPRGKVLFLRILSTWGDKYYVGLNGIEIFADTGELVSAKKVIT